MSLSRAGMIFFDPGGSGCLLQLWITAECRAVGNEHERIGSVPILDPGQLRGGSHCRLGATHGLLCLRSKDSGGLRMPCCRSESCQGRKSFLCLACPAFPRLLSWVEDSWIGNEQLAVFPELLAWHGVTLLSWLEIQFSNRREFAWSPRWREKLSIPFTMNKNAKLSCVHAYKVTFFRNIFLRRVKTYNSWHKA